MAGFTQSSKQYIRDRDIVLQRAKEYREENKEKIKSNQRIRHKNLSQEEKNKFVEKRKEWFNRQTKEKQEEMKRNICKK